MNLRTLKESILKSPSFSFRRRDNSKSSRALYIYIYVYKQKRFKSNYYIQGTIEEPFFKIGELLESLLLVFFLFFLEKVSIRTL